MFPLLVIAYPHFDPVALALGPFAIRWYALAYAAGLLIGYRYCLALTARPPGLVPRTAIDDLLGWVTLGVVLGGRLGYVLFYRPGFYVTEPLEAFAVWHGGMSFHGGLIGVTLALVLFARRRGISLRALGDLVACAVPIGLFFGRIANFVNGELWGRVSDVPWAMVFPEGGPLPRHPSQLYQATMEGLILFVVLLVMERRGARTRLGLVTGTFLIGYALARITGELFREPDEQLAFLVAALHGVTMGQILSLPMLLAGIWLVATSRPVAPAVAA